MKKLVILSAALSLGIVLALGASLFVRGAVKSDAVASAAEPGARGDGVVQQGIGVKGHWTIEVRNPDGTIASHTEFDNVLTAEGRRVLGRLLARETKVSSWMLMLEGGPSPCVTDDSVPVPTSCRIYQPAVGLPVLAESSANSYNLTAASTTNGFRLTGAKIASVAGEIHTVWSHALECYWSKTTVECQDRMQSPLGDYAIFSAHPIAQSITLVPGQQILVTLDVSFQPAT